MPWLLAHTAIHEADELADAVFPAEGSHRLQSMTLDAMLGMDTVDGIAQGRLDSESRPAKQPNVLFLGREEPPPAHHPGDGAQSSVLPRLNGQWPGSAGEEFAPGASQAIP